MDKLIETKLDECLNYEDGIEAYRKSDHKIDSVLSDEEQGFKLCLDEIEELYWK